MTRTNEIGTYVIRTRRWLLSEATQKINAPDSVAAMVAAHNSDELHPRFRTIRVRIQHDDVTPKRRDR